VTTWILKLSSWEHYVGSAHHTYARISRPSERSIIRQAERLTVDVERTLPNGETTIGFDDPKSAIDHAIHLFQKIAGPGDTLMHFYDYLSANPSEGKVIATKELGE